MCVPINLHCYNVKLQNGSVIFTFKVGTQFLNVTHRLDVVRHLCPNPSLNDKVTVRTRMCVPINSYGDNVKLQNVSVTLIFEVKM
jgi:hypothetical protein